MSAEEIAKQLGVAASSVYGWRSSGTLPKNPRIRSEYLRLEGIGDQRDGAVAAESCQQSTPGAA
jgi:hypothetical protein